MSQLNFCFVFLAVATCVLRSSKASEPVCSKFDNDKKLMEYMIETRQEVKKMAADLRRTEEYLLAVLEHRKGEMQNLSDNLKENLENGMQNTTDEVNSLKDDLKEKLERGMQNTTDEVNSLKDPNSEIVEKSKEGTDSPAERISTTCRAYNPADKNLQSNEVLIPKSVLFNEGNGYDTTTGKFTAPVGGLYHFTAHVCNTHGLVIHYAIVKGGEWVAASQQFEQADENDNKYASCSSVSALMMMKPGEKVWIMCTSGYSSAKQIHNDSYRRNSFIGVLLRK